MSELIASRTASEIIAEIKKVKYTFSIDYPQFDSTGITFEYFTKEFETENYSITVTGEFEFEQNQFDEAELIQISKLEIEIFDEDSEAIEITEKIEQTIENLIQYRF
jgi:hypothetical protein